MQQPQTRPLLGDSVSSTTSPTARRNNPVAVLTHQQLQQLQQLQAQNSTGQPLTFALQQSPGNNGQDQGNVSTSGIGNNHILYLNQLSQLNQSTINSTGTGMGLPPATPTFGVGLNMGLPLSLLNTSLTSLTSNVITTSNPLLNIGIPSLNSALTTVNPATINTINTLNALNTNLSSNSITANGLTAGIGQDLNATLNRLNTTALNHQSALNNHHGINQNHQFSTLNTNDNLSNLTNITNLNSQNTTNLNNPSHGISTSVNQAFNRTSLNVLATGLTPSSINSCSTSFPFQTIQSIQSIAPHIVGTSLSNQNNPTSTSIFTSTLSTPPILSTTSLNNPTSNNQSSSISTTTQSLNFAGTMQNSNLTNSSTSSVSISSLQNETYGHGQVRQFSQTQNSINQNAPGNTVVKCIQNVNSPGSPFSIPMKSPASNIAPPTPSPSPNRILLRSPASNSMQSNRNSPSPVSMINTSTSGSCTTTTVQQQQQQQQQNANFTVQLQSPMQSPMSVGPIQSPAPSPYPPAQSPHHQVGGQLSGGSTGNMNNRSPAPGGSPGPTPVVRPNTPILQQGMQVLQIIGTPQGYQQASSQLVTRAALFGNQQIQIATAKPAKQPPQILPKPPHSQQGVATPPKQRATTTITNQVTQQTQPQLVLAGPQQNQTATMIPTAQGLLLNQVLPSSGPVIVQQQPGGVQLILRTPTNAQQQTHTAQLTQQQLVRVVTAQGMQLQGITPTFFAVPNGFPPPAPPVMRHTPTSPAPGNSGNNNSIVIQNAMVQSPQSQMNNQITNQSSTNNLPQTQSVADQNLLPPPKKKAKKKKKTKKKDDEQPKLDLASIMKISGIGDEDDMFDNDIVPEPEPQIQSLPIQQHVEQPQVTQMTVQHMEQLSPHNPQLSAIPNTQQQSVIQSVNANCPTANTTQNPEAFGNQLVAQLQMPVQNTISGHLRLAVGEDGRVILHHTPDPNQPEIDQATAQALIRSLTQGTGQNSQIISQLLGHAQSLSQQNVQQQQNLNTSRSKASAKSSASAGNQTTNQMTPATSAPQMINVQQPQSCTKSPGSFSQQQGNVAGQRSINTCQLTKNNSAIQIAIGSGDSKLSKNEQNVKTITQSNVGHKSHVNAGNKKVVGQIFMQSPLQQPNTQRQNYVKTSASNLKMQTGNIVNNRTVQQQIKSPINVQQNRNQQQLEQQQSTEQMNQQQNIQQISTQTVQSLNVQRCLEQNIHKITVSGLQQNSLNILGGNSQQLPESIGQNLEQNIVHGFMDGQTNTSNNCHQDINEIHQQQQQQQQQQANASLNQQKLNLQNKQQNVIFTSDYPVSSHNTIINTSTGIGQATKQQQQQHQQMHINNPDILNSAATNILNNAPKITPEILNALSNLNPNDQLLIANANGQMQVISQQLLQQLLTGQLNAQNRATNVNQNQPQKIVIGDADASNSQNVQGVQINTPTSQIIVNSSGGAPTIQNNIQNIVVQAAPSQIPHQIQIQNQAFPSQFIDNLNQQQLRNLSSGNKTTNIVNTNQPVHQLSQSTNVTPPTPTPPVTTKKSRVVKRTKVTVSLANTSGYPTVKTTSRTASVSTSTSTSSASNSSKTAQNCANKNEVQTVGQLGIGRIVTSGIQTVGIQTQTSQSVPQVSVPSNGQMVQRTPRYIQLPVAKQQMLKSIQTQIQSIHSRKQNSPADQALLTKLYQEHNKIVASGKVVSAPSLTIPTQSETTTNAVISSTPSSTPSTPVYTISHPLSASVCKNQQTSTAQTQTMTQTCPVTVANQTLTPLASTSASMPIVHDNSANCISKIDKVQSAMDPSMPTIQTHTINNKTSIEMNKFHQPVTKLTGQYPTTIVTTTCHQSTTVTCQSTQMTQQQSAHCQTEPPDIKPNIQMINPIKQELSSPINVQVQIQSASPAGQVIASSPRTICGNKQQQRIQSPVNVSQIKQPLASPSTSTTGTTVQSPRQGIKRPATSPISRQINRSDLMEQQLKIDQNGAINPDVNTPFVSKRDACKRLVRYHCFNEQVLSAKDLAKADEIFEETAKHLLSKFNSMMNKYTYLLLMESMREVRTSELMMIDRTFVAEEQSMLTRLREQEAKASEEFKKEEKPVLPKLETDVQDDEKTTSSTALSNVLVKQELDDDFSCIDSHSNETQMRLKSSSCTSGDYDEWLEIQKELGVYPGESGKCKNIISSSCSGGGSGSNGALSGLSSRTTNKCERTRANGDIRATTSGTCVNNSVTKINYDDCKTTTTTTMELDKRWCSATDLERDLLEDTDSLDDLALQSHCPDTSLQDNDNDGNDLIDDQDDITAQVQSAIDSILNLKKRPSSAATAVNTNCVTTTSVVTTTQTTISNSSDTKDSVLDQAVRSILGS